MASCVGIDLAGVATRSTGLAQMHQGKTSVTIAVGHSDQEIIEFIEQARPNIIVIDAPLSLPRGRESIEKRSNIHFRECDRELTRRRIRFFPITLGPMRKLTSRGIALADRLRNCDYLIFEGYPGAAQDILGIPRKGEGVEALAEGLRNLGLEFRKDATHDELDAVTCAYVGLLHIANQSELIGDEQEGQILLPRQNNTA